MNSTLPSALKFDSFQGELWFVFTAFNFMTSKPPCACCTPSQIRQRSGPTYTAAAGHAVSRPFLVATSQCELSTSHSFLTLCNRALRSENLHSRGVASRLPGVAPIAEDSYCCPPRRSSAVSQSQVADHTPLRSAMSRRLGELLPHLTS